MYRSAIQSSVLVAVLLAGLISTPTAIGQQEEATSHLDPVADVLGAASFRHVGPVGNRVPAVVGVPGDANIYFAGAASGGVWKSTDGGHTWRPTFDDTGAASIGALAVAPSDPNLVWAGTGEAFLRSNVSHGNGVYRSTDAGESWQHRGLDATGRISRIVVDPRDPDVAFVAALGHVYGAQKERGVFRTRDGGETLGARALRGREHRRVGPGDGSEQSADPLRRPVADRDLDPRPAERRTGLGAVEVDATEAIRGCNSRAAGYLSRRGERWR